MNVAFLHTRARDAHELRLRTHFLDGAAARVAHRGPDAADELIPADALVEMDAKKAAGYFVDESVASPQDLDTPTGRALDDY